MGNGLTCRWQSRAGERDWGFDISLRSARDRIKPDSQKCPVENALIMGTDKMMPSDRTLTPSTTIAYREIYHA
jgi:hypothetical protein